MTAAWNFFVHVLGTMPIWLAAFLVGWAMSVSITHGFKFILPVSMPDWLREDLTRFVAFMSGAIPSGWWAADAGYGILGVSVQAVVTGVWSPVAFALLMAWLRRTERWAWVADVLSADKRGVLAAKLRGDPSGGEQPGGRSVSRREILGAFEILGALAIVFAGVALAAWLGYEAGYSDGWNAALFHADTVDMELRGVKP